MQRDAFVLLASSGRGHCAHHTRKEKESLGLLAQGVEKKSSVATAPTKGEMAPSLPWGLASVLAEEVGGEIRRRPADKRSADKQGRPDAMAVYSLPPKSREGEMKKAGEVGRGKWPIALQVGASSRLIGQLVLLAFCAGKEKICAVF